MTRQVKPGLILMLALLAGAVRADGHPLIGTWTFVEASFPFPAACRALSYRFDPDGSLFSTDGHLAETKSYQVKRRGKGYLIEMRYLANNGKANCQAIPAEEVRANTLRQVYVEAPGNGRIKMYFDSRPSPTFIVLERARDLRRR